MDLKSFISPSLGESVRKDFHRLFLTAKDMGETIDVTLVRDNPDIGTENIEYTGVLLTFAARQADVQRGGGVITVATQGQLARELPFAPKPGDTFIIKGVKGRILVVYPEMNDIVRADIIFTNPYA